MKFISCIKKMIPSKLKTIIKQTSNYFLFILKYKFIPPPVFTDMSGYEFLLDTIIDKKIYLLEGDIVEIGTFIGGGVYKLSRLLEKLKVEKKIYVLDTFNLSQEDHTDKQWHETIESHKKIIRENKQYEVYKKITKNCNNIITLVGDSKKATLPCKKISFAYIDGNHSYEYVKDDFYLVWEKLVSKGIVAFHDYNFDQPGTIRAIHAIIGEKNDEILRVWINDLKSTVLIQKK